MALNRARTDLGRAGLRAFSHQETPFRAEADAELTSFREFRDDLARKVARGDMTVKVARQQAAEAADSLRNRLTQKSQGYSPVPRVFLDRLISAHSGRLKAREGMTLEGLQRETNRLLRAALIEQQLKTRAAEFEGRAYTRPVAGGPPVPTLGAILAFHESSTHAGDDAAQEWARRQLESMRNRVLNPEDQQRIDHACDRADRFNPRIVTRYLDSLQGSDSSSMEEFVDQAIDSRDANACSAAFLMAREEPTGLSARWVRRVLDGLAAFPDAALEALRACEVEARSADAEAATSRAELAAALAETEARFDDLKPPTPEAIRRQERILARPVAAPSDPIGLNLGRRGMTSEEFAELAPASDEATSAID